MPLVDFFSHGGSLKSSWYGDCLPERDFPTLIDLYLQGRLPLEKFVSERIGLGDIEEAFHKMHDGKVLRSVVVLVMVAIDRVVTHGTFELDGGSWEVDNNIWLVGDDSDVVVFDAAHDAEPIIEAVGGRNVVAVVCTHGHNDHVTVAPELGKALDAPVLLHPADEVLWRMTHPDKDFRAVADGETLQRGRHRIAGAAHPGPLPRIGVLVRARPRCGVQRRHPVLRRAGRDGPLVLRLPDDSAVDLGAARQAARRHRRAHRPRRQHHHRRRDRPLRGMGEPAATDVE